MLLYLAINEAARFGYTTSDKVKKVAAFCRGHLMRSRTSDQLQ